MSYLRPASEHIRNPQPFRFLLDDTCKVYLHVQQIMRHHQLSLMMSVPCTNEHVTGAN